MATAPIARRAAGWLRRGRSPAAAGAIRCTSCRPTSAAFLPARVVLDLSDPGDVVLDPFSGRGTTIFEALLCGRDAIGTDASQYAMSCRARRPSRSGSTSSRRICARSWPTPRAWKQSSGQRRPPRLLRRSRRWIELLRLREVLRGDDSREANFAKAVVCGVLHGPSARCSSRRHRRIRRARPSATCAATSSATASSGRSGTCSRRRSRRHAAPASTVFRAPRSRAPQRLPCTTARRREHRPDRHLAAVPRRARLRVEQLAAVVVARLRPARGARQADPVAPRGRLSRVHGRHVCGALPRARATTPPP